MKSYEKVLTSRIEQGNYLERAQEVTLEKVEGCS